MSWLENVLGWREVTVGRASLGSRLYAGLSIMVIVRTTGLDEDVSGNANEITREVVLYLSARGYNAVGCQ